jgi:hypothetical protein
LPAKTVLSWSLALPPMAVSENCGKNCALATPILALAAMSFASAC